MRQFTISKNTTRCSLAGIGFRANACLICVFCLLYNATFETAQAALISTLYSTGVDATGALLPQGVADPHYTISAVNQPPPGPFGEPVSEPTPGAQIAANQNAFVVLNSQGPFGLWVPNGPASQWVSPSASSYGDSVLFTYKTSFDLTGLDTASTVISGSWAVDDPGWMYLNGKLVAELPFGWMFMQLHGQQVAPNAPQYTGNHEFQLDSGFVAGVNTLEFVVWNSGGGPTGLRVDFGGTTDVPEGGSSAALLGVTLAGCVALKRRTGSSPAFRFV